MAYKYIAKFATSKIMKKLGKRLSGKALKASQRNIKKAIAASARKRGKAIVGGLRTASFKGAVKGYGRSVVRRTVKRRAKKAAKVAVSLKATKFNAVSLSKKLLQQDTSFRIVKGSKAKLIESKAFQASSLNVLKKKIEKKGTDGLFGYLRKRELNKVNLALAGVNKQLNAEKKVVEAARRAVAQTDGALAFANRSVENLTKKYLSLTAAAGIGDKARTVASDALTVATVGGSGYAGFQQYKKKRSKKT